MLIRIIVNLILLSIVLMVSASGSGALAQQSTAVKQDRPELAFEYNYVHSNVPPGNCACFSLNGGSATFAWPLGQRGLAAAVDVSVDHADSISKNNLSLTLSTYTAGLRYSPPIGHSPLRPFGQLLFGLAHSSGSLVEKGISPASNAGGTFAVNLGGGLDMRATRRLSLRLIEANYLLTTFDNGRNNHQNNLRLGTGVVFRF